MPLHSSCIYGVPTGSVQGVVGTGARALESSDGREQVAEREAGPEVGPVKKKKKRKLAESRGRPEGPAGPAARVTLPGGTGSSCSWGSWRGPAVGRPTPVCLQGMSLQRSSLFSSSAQLICCFYWALRCWDHCTAGKFFFLTFLLYFIFVISWNNIICAHI